MASTAIKIDTTGSTPVCSIVYGSYKGDEETQRVAEILGLDRIKGWSIRDRDVKNPNLVLVHFDENDPESTKDFGHLRGVVLDLKTGGMIATSFGHTPTVVAESITNTGDKIILTDKVGTVHTFDALTCHMKRGFECVVFRVIRYQGETYFCTHKRINSERSRWGSSAYFRTMYQEAGGPTEEQLFDMTVPSSSTCYVFGVVHQSLLVGSRQIVNKPYVIHLTNFTMDLKLPAEEFAPGVASFTTSSVISGQIDESFIHAPACLNLTEANKHLKYGFYDPPAIPTLADSRKKGTAADFPADPRQGTGEMIIIYNLDPKTGEVTNAVKVHSPAFDWRVNMRGNNPNIVNQFYTLLDSTYNDLRSEKEWQELLSRFIPFPLYEESSIRARFERQKCILSLPQRPCSRTDYANREDRIYLLWLNFLVSLPSCLQEKGLSIYTDFKADRKRVLDYILNVEKTTPDVKNTDQHRRVKDIILKSRQFAKQRVDDRKNITKEGSRISLPTLIKSNIRNLLLKEHGTSLYDLVSYVRDPKLYTEKKQKKLSRKTPA